MAEKEREVSSINGNLVKLEREVERLTKLESDLNDEMSQTQNALSRVTAENEKNKRLVEELNQCKEELGKTTTEKDRIQKELDSQSFKLSRLDGQHSQTVSNIEGIYKAKNKELFSSLSWALLAPAVEQPFIDSPGKALCYHFEEERRNAMYWQGYWYELDD